MIFNFLKSVIEFFFKLLIKPIEIAIKWLEDAVNTVKDGFKKAGDWFEEAGKDVGDFFSSLF